MTDPFAGHEPVEEEYEKLPAVQLSTIGDTFKGTVTRIGSDFVVDYDGKSFVKYPIELELTYVSIKPLPEIEDLQRAYEPPKVGETAVFFVTAVKPDGKPHHVGEEISKAAKNAGSHGLNEGDALAGKLIDKVKSKKNTTYKPFKKHAFLIDPAVPAAPSDPFSGEAPF